VNKKLHPGVEPYDVLTKLLTASIFLFENRRHITHFTSPKFSFIKKQTKPNFIHFTVHKPQQHIAYDICNHEQHQVIQLQLKTKSLTETKFYVQLDINKKPSYRWGTARRGRASWNLV